MSTIRKVMISNVSHDVDISKPIPFADLFGRPDHHPEATPKEWPGVSSAHCSIQCFAGDKIIVDCGTSRGAHSQFLNSTDSGGATSYDAHITADPNILSNAPGFHATNTGLAGMRMNARVVPDGKSAFYVFAAHADGQIGLDNNILA